MSTIDRAVTLLRSVRYPIELLRQALGPRVIRTLPNNSCTGAIVTGMVEQDSGTYINKNCWEDYHSEITVTFNPQKAESLFSAGCILRPPPLLCAKLRRFT